MTRSVPRSVHGTVELPAPVEVAFDYLADPRNRAQWQSSLRRVDDVQGTPDVGQTWVDVTVPGLRPRMRTTVFERPERWAESGRWRWFTADLDLRFEPLGADRCRVHVRFAVTGPGLVALVGTVATVLARPAVLADVRRAGRELARGAT